ncbi:MAG: glycosyltransferase [Verrucomicrobia bacterium]|nr:glycosyltransferase [Verrucomicrobiota bacterium]
MKQTICLNMIVKNERKIIERCLNSVKKIIDYWVIVDTGSTDGTQEVILECMKDIPGELYEKPWVDFAYNRNEALALAKDKADYILFIDADEQLLYEADFQMPPLTKHFYFFLIQQKDGINYFRESLVLSKLNWTWRGPVHENVSSTEAKEAEILSGITNLSITEDGARYRDPKKYLKDAAILEKALKDDPNNDRYVFYIALSYGNAKDYRTAKKWHEKRVAMGGFEEEVFYSLLSIGKIEENLKAPPEQFVNSYAKAFQYRPIRAEPLYFLANYYIRIGNYLLAYLTSKMGLSIPVPKDIIFVQHPVYDTELLLQFADCSFYMKQYGETYEAYQKLLTKKTLSEETRASIEKNLPVIEKLL